MGNISANKNVVKQERIYVVPEESIILSEGEQNLDMYKLVSGHVEMYTGYGTDNEVLIGILGPGACFGEFGLLTGLPAIYTVITYSQVEILRVTEKDIDKFMEENRDDALQIMRNMAKNMMRMQHQINQIGGELALELGENSEEIRAELNKVNIKNYTLYGAPGRKAYDKMSPDMDLKGKMRFMNRKKDT